jgi:hypothetical protein
VQIFFLFFGLFGVGTDLDKLVSQRESIPNDKKFSGIFNNIGLGIAMIAVWSIAIDYFPNIWGRTLAFFLDRQKGLDRDPQIGHAAGDHN